MKLPDDFLFGVSTSAYQIEGGHDRDGRGPSIWDRFSHMAGATHDEHHGDVACDHYSHWPADLDLIADAGFDAYRFSVSWPRVQPAGRGAPLARGLDFYDRLVDETLERGIEPWLCLYHWDLPDALQDRGGWAARDIVYRYCDYALEVHRRLGDRVRRWVLFNEPSIAAMFGYVWGIHAPGRRVPSEGARALHHFNLATAEAARLLRSATPSARRSELEIGTVLAMNWIEPATDRQGDRAAAEILRAFLEDASLDPLLGRGYPEPVKDLMGDALGDGDLERLRVKLDFLGVNHYTRIRAAATDASPLLGAGFAEPDEDRPTTETGWEVFPDGLFLQLVDLKRRVPEIPLYVTENGAACPDRPTLHGSIEDHDRIDFVRRYLEAGFRAREAGVDLRGWFVWTLLDNFEWSHGYSKRFGLVHVDFETLARTPKASYRWITEVLREREIEL